MAQLAARLAGSQEVTGSTPVRSTYTMLKQAHMFVKGDVIGVGFRAWVKIQAKKFNTRGWARNVFDRPDVFGRSGGVEVVAQGEEDDLKVMIESLRSNHPLAHINTIELLYEDPKNIFDSFEIVKSTAQN